jgi:hypothetical protein
MVLNTPPISRGAIFNAFFRIEPKIPPWIFLPAPLGPTMAGSDFWIHTTTLRPYLQVQTIFDWPARHISRADLRLLVVPKLVIRICDTNCIVLHRNFSASPRAVHIPPQRFRLYKFLLGFAHGFGFICVFRIPSGQ